MLKQIKEAFVTILVEGGLIVLFVLMLFLGFYTILSFFLWLQMWAEGRLSL